MATAAVRIVRYCSNACLTFQYSNAKKLDSFLRYIIVTPNLHRIHHSAYQPETDSNFSAVFPIWDILFGTFRTKTRLPSQSMELGLEEIRDNRTSNIQWLLLSPFKTFRKKKERVNMNSSSLYRRHWHQESCNGRFSFSNIWIYRLSDFRVRQNEEFFISINPGSCRLWLCRAIQKLFLFTSPGI
jgi:hypothetical protein